MMNNGIIPYRYKRIVCYLWKGHDYRVISPEIGTTGKHLIECKNCGKRKLSVMLPSDFYKR